MSLLRKITPPSIPTFISRALTMWMNAPLPTPEAQMLYHWLEPQLAEKNCKISMVKKMTDDGRVVAERVKVNVISGVDYELELYNEIFLHHHKCEPLCVETDINGKGWVIPANAIEDATGHRIHWMAVRTGYECETQENAIVGIVPEHNVTVIIRGV